MRTLHTTRGARAGYSLLELSVSVSLFIIVLLSSLALIERDTRLSQATISIHTVEILAQEMLFDIERELASAQGANPMAIVTSDLAAGATDALTVDSTLGFPASGTLLLDRGTPQEERITYASLAADQVRFLDLDRAQMCTDSNSHASGGELVWMGLAEPLELQDDPPADTYDGIALEARGPVFYRGDGTGFSYRVPVDPDQVPGTAPDFMDGDELQWGATVGGAEVLAGWACIQFVPTGAYTEAQTGDDLNGDGDTDDVFEIGQLRKRTWNVADPTAPVFDLGLGPRAVIQERCNYGGDLDNDGFDDPIFLWDKERRQLHVRLMILGLTRSDMPVLRQVESVMFLRNEQEL